MPSIMYPDTPCHFPDQPAEQVLLGVDTHKDVHAAAVVTVLGTIVDRRSFPTTLDLVTRIAQAVKASRPRLPDVRGIGPDSAAAFAALCGVSPVEQSSGKTQRRRLNRGGDRQANAALHRAVLSRLRWDPRTQDYLRRRLTEGKTRREIIRCLKRYVAREIYRLLSPATTPSSPATPTSTAA